MPKYRPPSYDSSFGQLITVLFNIITLSRICKSKPEQGRGGVGDLAYPPSEAPMCNVTNYLQKLGMGVYNNENEPGVLKKTQKTRGSLAKKRQCFCIAKTKRPEKDIKVSAKVLRKCFVSSLILLWQPKSAQSALSSTVFKI